MNKLNEAICIEILAGILIFILSVRFSIAYFSYFILLALLGFCYICYCSYKNHCMLLANCDSAIKWMTLGVTFLYGTLFISSLFLHDMYSVKSTVKLFYFCLPLFVMWFIGSKSDGTKGFEIGLCSGIALDCLYGLAEHFKIIHLTVLDPKRMQSFFPHPNTFGVILILCIPFIIYFLYKSKVYAEKILLTCVLALDLICLIFTGSRGALTSIFVGLMGTLLLLIFENRVSIWANIFHSKKILFGIVIFFLISVVALNFVYDQRGNNVGERIIMREASIEMWEDHKILGVGVARWGENYYSPTYHPIGAHETGLITPHNMPLYFLSISGIVGEFGYLAFSVITFAILFRNMKRKNNSIATAMMAAYLAFFAESMVDATLSNKPITLLFMGLLGYSIGQIERYKD